jgi:carbonic anhydrase
LNCTYKKADHNLAVLTVLFDVSDENTDLLTTLVNATPEISRPGSITSSGRLDFTSIIKHLESTPLRQYSGSLTTPPCKEGITFLIAERPLPINSQSLKAMKKILKFNSRFNQGGLGETNLIEKAAQSVMHGRD